VLVLAEVVTDILVLVEVAQMGEQEQDLRLMLTSRVDMDMDQAEEAY
jgi:hypothetical protein